MSDTELMKCLVTCVTLCAHGIWPYWSSCLKLAEIDEPVQWHLLNGKKASRRLKSCWECEIKWHLWAGRNNHTAFTQLLPCVLAPQLSPVHCSSCCVGTSHCSERVVLQTASSLSWWECSVMLCIFWISSYLGLVFLMWGWMLEMTLMVLISNPDSTLQLFV